MRRFFLMVSLLLPALAGSLAAQNNLYCGAATIGRTFPSPSKARFTFGVTCDIADTAALNLLNRALAAKGDTLIAAKAVIVRLQDSLAKLTAAPVPAPIPTPTPVPTPAPTPTPTPVPAGIYFNSSEPGCGDANSLLCDDFERTWWYRVDGDHAIEAGWGGTIYANPITPPGAAVCGGQGYRSTCAATHGQTSGGQGGRNMAEHVLARAVPDLYIRFYTHPSAGYTFGAEKVLSVNRVCCGGIFWGNLHLNQGGGTGPTGTLSWQGIVSPTLQTGYTLTGGRWYYIEVHLKINTPGQADGVLEIWADDCGAAGTTCPATPTLRGRSTAYQFTNNGAADRIGSLWWENWANPGSTGERLIDQIKVSTVGPVGFMR